MRINAFLEACTAKTMGPEPSAFSLSVVNLAGVCSTRTKIVTFGLNIWLHSRLFSNRMSISLDKI